MPAGYSRTPLLKKLGIKSGHRIIWHNPIEGLMSLLGELPDDIEICDYNAESADFIHLFVREESTLLQLLPECKQKLDKQGLMWISWPKKASKIPTDLNRDIIRVFGLEAGLVDVKVCAIDENWSGLKFVYRLKDRK